MFLLKEASDPNIVIVGCEIVAKYGQEALGRVVMLHFKKKQTFFRTKKVS